MKNERFEPEIILEKTNRGYGSVNVMCGVGFLETRKLRSFDSMGGSLVTFTSEIFSHNKCSLSFGIGLMGY